MISERAERFAIWKAIQDGIADGTIEELPDGSVRITPLGKVRFTVLKRMGEE